MAWGIELVISVSEAVSTWSGSEMAAPAWPQYALLLILMGGLWLALWRQSWRYAGVGLILVGIGSAVSYERPYMLVDRDGSNLAVRSSTGDLLALSDRKARFAVSRWLQGEGLLPDHDQSDARSRLYRCDVLGCITVDPGRPIVAFVTDPRAFAEDCQRADFIVASVPIPKSQERSCRRYAIVIDRYDLQQEGAHAVWFEQGGPRVVSAADRRGSRPWSSFRESLKLLRSAESKDARQIQNQQAQAPRASITAVR